MEPLLNRRPTRVASALRVGLTGLVGVAATLVATSAAIQVASVRGPQFDVLLGPLDPAIEGAEVFVVGTLAGAVAVVCGLRLWQEVRPNGGSRGPSVTQSND